MSISSSVTQYAYTGNGVTPTFNYNNKIMAQTELAVYVNGALMSYGGDYTVAVTPDTSADGYSSAAVVFTVAPANGAAIVIVSNPSNLQPVNLPSNGPLPSSSIEGALDRLTLGLQSVASKIGKFLSYSPTYVGGVSTAIGDPVAGNFLRTNLAGTALEWVNVVASSIGTFLASGTGAVSRTFQAKCGDIVSVKDFGAAGDGVTVDSAAIQASHDAMPAAGGGLFVPQGTYVISTAITVSKPCKMFGIGRGSVFKTNSAINNILTVSGDHVNIDGIYFTSSVVRSGGYYVDFQATASRSSITNFSMSGAVGNIRITNTATVLIADGDILNSVASTGIVVRIDGGSDIAIRGVVADQAANIFAGVYITACSDVTLIDCNLIHCGNCLSIHPAVGQVVASVWGIGTFFDTSTRGLLIDPAGAGASVVRCGFNKCWFSSHGNEGALLSPSASATVDTIEFNNCEFYSNGLDGLKCGSSLCNEIIVRGGVAAGNAGAGFSFAANQNNFMVTGARSGNSGGFSGNNYGVFVAAGTGNNYQIVGCNLLGNTINNLSNAATGATSMIEHNLGALRQGSFTPVLAFGGASVGITYGSSQGSWQRVGDRIFVTWFVTLTSKGASVGNATMGGLPFVSSNLGGTMAPLFCSNMTAGVGDTHLQSAVISGDNKITPYKITAGNAVQLTDADFTNTSLIYVSTSYQVTP